MKRALTRTLTVGALIALLAATLAFAATKTYKGQIKNDQGSSTTLKVKTTDGERAVRLFAARDFQIACDSGVKSLKRAAISGLVPINEKGKFRVSGTNAGQELRVSGKLIGKRSAKGTVRYFGPTPVGDELEDCDSGKLDWTASR